MTAFKLTQFQTVTVNYLISCAELLMFKVFKSGKITDVRFLKMYFK